MGVSKVSLAMLFFIKLTVLAFPLRTPLKGFTAAPHSIAAPPEKSFIETPFMAPPPQSVPVKSAQEFVDAHNKARAEVGVAPVKWNSTVATYAQKYAAHRAKDCELLHSGGSYGENIAEASWDLTPGEAVQMWVDEKPFFNYTSNECNGGECLHYTQVIWHDSVSVGCAKVECKNNHWFFVTCNYDPPGNFEGEKPY